MVYFFNGIVVEVAVFTEDLSPEDIAAIAEHGLAGTQAVSPSSKLATACGHVKTR
jgi:hypothetical protein